MPKSIIIIGAGIAGLATGCYARMNGYESRIFELHDQPGGLCAAWKRKDYTFDGCIHWLVGSNPKSLFRRLWDELGALQGKRIVDQEEFQRYEGKDGKTFILYTDVDRLERHLKELAPADAAVIEELTAGIRKLARMDMPIENPGLIGGLRLGLKMAPLLGTFKKYGKITLPEFAARFKDPFLREVFTEFWGELSNMPLVGLMITMGVMSARNAGYPVGGSLAFAKAIEGRYLDLGGEIRYKARVAKILVENDIAVGVRLTDGTEHRADYVVSAADGYATIFEMLEGKYVDDKIRGLYNGGLEPFPPMIQVSLGVARDLTAEPHMANFPLDAPLTISGKTLHRMGYKHYCYDPTLAPAGKSAMVVSFMTDYEYWKKLYEDRLGYQAEKKRLADEVVARLNLRFPGLSEQVEVVDVATPMTYERYTGNWRASFEGWLITTKSIGLMFGKGLPKSLPGLANFHMIGQWTTPGGGLPPAAKDGRDVIKRICKQERRPFRTTLAHE